MSASIYVCESCNTPSLALEWERFTKEFHGFRSIYPLDKAYQEYKEGRGDMAWFVCPHCHLTMCPSNMYRLRHDGLTNDYFCFLLHKKEEGVAT